MARVLLIKHRPHQGPPPGKDRSQPLRLWPVFLGSPPPRGPQCGGPAWGRCADAHGSEASPAPPAGWSELAPLCDLPALRKCHQDAPCACAGPSPNQTTEGLPRGPGHAFTPRSPAEQPQRNQPAADPGLGRLLRPLVPLAPRGPRSVTIFPFPGRWVDDAKEFVTGDGLGVQVHGHRLPFQVLVGLVQRPEHLQRRGATYTGLRGRTPCPHPMPGSLCELSGPLKTHGQKPSRGPASPWRHAGVFASPRQHPGHAGHPEISPLCAQWTAALPGPGKRGIVPDNTSNMCSLEKIKGRKLPAVLPLRGKSF